MATTKWNMVSIELSRRLGDPVSAANDSGEWLTADVRNAYVNKALHKLFSDTIVAVNGDKQAFVKIFPELLSAPTQLTLGSGNYIISSGAASIKNIWKPWQCYYIDTNGKYIFIRDLDESLYTIMLTGINNDFQASQSSPAMLYMAGTIYFFPLSSTFSPYLIYIKLPLVSSTGNEIEYSAGAGEDMPYGYQWIPKLAEIGEQLFRIDKQETA